MAGLRDKPRVWALADVSEDGVFVTNAKTEATVFVPPDAVRWVRVESPRTGRVARKALAPGRRIGSEGRFALVLFGDQKVPVRPETLVDPDGFEPDEAPALAHLRGDAEGE